MAKPNSAAVRSSSLHVESSLTSLRDMEALERELSAEVRRLVNVRAAWSTTNDRPLVAGRPVVWWRRRLARWLKEKASRDGRRANPLRGLDAALRDFDDQQLQSFVESLAETEPRRSTAARPGPSDGRYLQRPPAGAGQRGENTSPTRPPNRAV